jgi:hypothetical protein
MSITITTTIGSASANSYVTPAEFAAYKEANSVVLATQDDADKTARCLVIAANRLNRENWLGNPVSTTQRLKWPRTDVEKPDQPGNYGAGWGYGGWFSREFFAVTEIPQLVKDAQCQLAMEYELGFVEGNGEDVEEFQGDGVRVKFGSGRRVGGLPDEVMRLIQDLVEGNTLVRA